MSIVQPRTPARACGTSCTCLRPCWQCSHLGPFGPVAGGMTIIAIQFGASREHLRSTFLSLVLDRARKGYFQHEPRSFPPPTITSIDMKTMQYKPPSLVPQVTATTEWGNQHHVILSFKKPTYYPPDGLRTPMSSSSLSTVRKGCASGMRWMKTGRGSNVGMTSRYPNAVDSKLPSNYT